MPASDLPIDMLFEIFQFLDLRSLATLRAVNRTCNIIAENVTIKKLRQAILKGSSVCSVQIHTGTFDWGDNYIVQNHNKENPRFVKDEVYVVEPLYRKFRYFEDPRFKFSSWKWRNSAWEPTQRPRAKKRKVSDENRFQNMLLEICLTVELDVDDNCQSAKIIYGICHHGLDDLSNVGFRSWGNSQRMYLRTVEPSSGTRPFPKTLVQRAHIRDEILVITMRKCKRGRFDDDHILRNLLEVTFLDSAEAGRRYHPFLCR
jgi:F-box domain